MTLSPEHYAFLDKLFPEVEWKRKDGAFYRETKFLNGRYKISRYIDCWELAKSRKLIGDYDTLEEAKAAARKHQIETIAQNADLDVLDQTHTGTMWRYWATKCRELAEKNKALQVQIPVWRDIESAPKDGTEIVLYKTPNKECNVPFWVIGKFVGRDELMPYGQCYKDDDCCGACPEPKEFKIKVLVTSWNHKDISSTGFTHWMPLPTPPETEK